MSPLLGVVAFVAGSAAVPLLVLRVLWARKVRQQQQGATSELKTLKREETVLLRWSLLVGLAIAAALLTGLVFASSDARVVWDGWFVFSLTGLGVGAALLSLGSALDAIFTTRRNRWHQDSLRTETPIEALLALGLVCLAVAAVAYTGRILHHSEDDLAFMHARHTAAVAEQLAAPAVRCAETANEATADGAALLASVTDDNASRTASALLRVNSRYVNGVRCLLTEAQWLVPGDRGERSRGRGLPPPLWCLPPVTGEAFTDVRDRLQVEADLWQENGHRLDGHLTLGTAPGTVFDTYQHLTSDERFPEDMGALHPVFAPTGEHGAWVAYHPDDGAFTVTPPTVEQLTAFCQTAARDT